MGDVTTRFWQNWDQVAQGDGALFTNLRHFVLAEAFENFNELPLVVTLHVGENCGHKLHGGQFTCDDIVAFSETSDHLHDGSLVVTNFALGKQIFNFVSSFVANCWLFNAA